MDALEILSRSEHPPESFLNGTVATRGGAFFGQIQEAVTEPGFQHVRWASTSVDEADKHYAEAVLLQV